MQSIKNYYVLMTNLSGELIPGWKQFAWIAGCCFVIIGGLSLASEMTMTAGDIIVYLSGEMPISNEALAAIFAITFICLILVSIQNISDKNERLQNQTIDELLKVMQLNRFLIYLSGYTVKLTALSILSLLTLICLYLSILILFQIHAYMIINALWMLIYISAILLVIFDFFYLVGGKSNTANTYTTLMLVIVLVLNATFRPFMIQMGASEAILFLTKAAFPDLFMYSYVAALQILESTNIFSDVIPSIAFWGLFLGVNIFLFKSK